MTNDAQIQKSIVEQIYDELFLILEETDFDQESIEKLRQLAQDGKLKRESAVTNIIEAIAEQQE